MKNGDGMEFQNMVQDKQENYKNIKKVEEICNLLQINISKQLENTF